MSATCVLTAPTSADSPAMTGPGVPLPRVDRPTPTALAAVAEVLATREDLWRRLVRAGGRRWSTRVAGGEGWEAWLVAWPVVTGRNRNRWVRRWRWSCWPGTSW